ncbi:hypothetical protein CY34DRAFT_131309 [Suillus luteus UH-Slu-Lm8-n1]|uniref:Uncharacterized protein n=1 Tax=Suillus luteus UH-Slu-Lm8-n1 TaxID=930992 RepID=A0A0D0A3B3_9AGAM|nr:hypothetical protein CY34DRAFT_131309 [Suillus luteus UH-Slu-Lm8-n1]
MTLVLAICPWQDWSTMIPKMNFRPHIVRYQTTPYQRNTSFAAWAQFPTCRALTASFNHSVKVSSSFKLRLPFVHLRYKALGFTFLVVIDHLPLPQTHTSHFVMKDEHLTLTLFDIMERDIQVPHAEFAFLSASHTAVGDKETPDEIIHLAAGLQFSEFMSSLERCGRSTMLLQNTSSKLSTNISSIRMTVLWTVRRRPGHLTVLHTPWGRRCRSSRGWFSFISEY